MKSSRKAHRRQRIIRCRRVLLCAFLALGSGENVTAFEKPLRYDLNVAEAEKVARLIVWRPVQRWFLGVALLFALLVCGGLLALDYTFQAQKPDPTLHRDTLKAIGTIFFPLLFAPALLLTAPRRLAPLLVGQYAVSLDAEGIHLQHPYGVGVIPWTNVRQVTTDDLCAHLQLRSRARLTPSLPGRLPPRILVISVPHRAFTGKQTEPQFLATVESFRQGKPMPGDWPPPPQPPGNPSRSRRRGS
jgi:hypothetical protein